MVATMMRVLDLYAREYDEQAVVEEEEQLQLIIGQVTPHRRKARGMQTHHPDRLQLGSPRCRRNSR